MAEKLTWNVTVTATGGPRLVYDAIIDVDAYDKISIVVPANGEITVDLGPSAAGRMACLVVVPATPSGDLTYEVGDNTITLDQPQFLFGGAVALTANPSSSRSRTPMPQTTRPSRSLSVATQPLDQTTDRSRPMAANLTQPVPLITQDAGLEDWHQRTPRSGVPVASPATERLEGARHDLPRADDREERARPAPGHVRRQLRPHAELGNVGEVAANAAGNG